MLFDSVFGGQGVPAPGNDFWYEPIYMTASGTRVTPITAMKVSACYAAIKVLAETVASIPLTMYRRVDDRTVLKSTDHPLQDIFEIEPNKDQTPFEFWEMQVSFGALFGTAYAERVAGKRGAVDQLLPLRADLIRPERLSSGRLRYRYDDPLTQKERIFTEDEIWRMPGFSFDGIEGIAPIVFAQDSIGLALAAEIFGGKFFKNDATPSVVLEHPKPLKPEGVKNIRDSWTAAHRGLENKFSVSVLEEGMTVKTLGITNRDSQFIEARKHQIAEIARFFRIPLHMLSELDKSSFNNIEQQSIEFVKYTIRPHLTKIEQRIRKDLIIDNRKYFARANLDELLRGEIEPRYSAYSTAIQSGFMTPNEARERENMNPLDGLDKPMRPLNMGTADSAMNNVVDDAAARVVSSEVANLEKLIEKDEADFGDYYETKLKPYVEKTFKPICAMFDKVGIDVRSASEVAENYIASRHSDIINAENKHALVAEWKKATADDKRKAIALKRS